MKIAMNMIYWIPVLFKQIISRYLPEKSGLTKDSKKSRKIGSSLHAGCYK